MSKTLSTLIEQLDLEAHISSLEHFFSRFHSLSMEGDQELHFKYISALEKLEFKAPPKIESFETPIMHLKKHGVLRFEQIFEIIKLMRYLRYWQNRDLDGLIGKWISKINTPLEIAEIDGYFQEDGRFDESKDESLYALSNRAKTLKSDMAATLKRQIFTQKASAYIVDTQVHYYNDEECILVRGGFNHVIKGVVIGRSSSGFFYVVPESISKVKSQLQKINHEKEIIFYEYAKKFSAALQTISQFLKFVDKEFNRFDHYQARVLFARSKSLQIVDAQKDSHIELNEFSHPALSNPKPVDVVFKKSVLMITGVNAGGKTMLLKSILSAAFMAKYLIPMKINATKSHIGRFKYLTAVIDDPQNVANDISTFAGRMQQFSKLFDIKDALVGVDEIELGTDSDEAAALFKIILDDLIKKGQKIVVTTHHKRLAALMADRDDVELMAAIYDEEKREPTYEFLHGIIGKSFAFETALRYGIASSIVTRAKETYGQNHEKLNLLIERGSELERDLKRKNREIDERLEALKTKEQILVDAKAKVDSDLTQEKNRLQNHFDIAINEAKKAAKLNDTAAIHRQMNKANQTLPKKDEATPKSEPYTFSVGQKVKYRSSRGTILSLKSKEAMVEVDGMRLRIKLTDLKPSGNFPKKQQKTHVHINVEKRSGLKLDLHGLRAEEACERLDKFLSDALISGWDEVIVYHGIGTGKLSYAVKEFLITHPSVKKFDDAPQHMGGFGAKIVTL